MGHWTGHCLANTSRSCASCGWWRAPGQAAGGLLAAWAHVRNLLAEALFHADHLTEYVGGTTAAEVVRPYSVAKSSVLQLVRQTGDRYDSGSMLVEVSSVSSSGAIPLPAPPMRGSGPAGVCPASPASSSRGAQLRLMTLIELPSAKGPSDRSDILEALTPSNQARGPRSFSPRASRHGRQQLAKRFAIHRTTVAALLRRNEVQRDSP